MNSVLQAFADWLHGCPLLADQRLNVNYLGAEPVEYAIIEAPTTPVLQSYLDGSSIRQRAVAITAVKDYSSDLLQQLAETGFWEVFARRKRCRIWAMARPAWPWRSLPPTIYCKPRHRQQDTRFSFCSPMSRSLFHEKE